MVNKKNVSTKLSVADVLAALAAAKGGNNGPSKISIVRDDLKALLELPPEDRPAVTTTGIYRILDKHGKNASSGKRNNPELRNIVLKLTEQGFLEERSRNGSTRQFYVAGEQVAV